MFDHFGPVKSVSKGLLKQATAYNSMLLTSTFTKPDLILVKLSFNKDWQMTNFRSIFEGATMLPPPCGIGHSPQSGAMYAADLMLAW